MVGDLLFGSVQQSICRSDFFNELSFFGTRETGGLGRSGALPILQAINSLLDLLEFLVDVGGQLLVSVVILIKSLSELVHLLSQLIELLLLNVVFGLGEQGAQA